MVKSRSILIAILFCVSITSVSLINQTQAAAQPLRSTAARRQQAHVKRINQRALQFYKAFIRQSVRNTAAVDCELKDLLEDFLLALDALNAGYVRHQLVTVMQIASDIEKELLFLDISEGMILAWSRLHADVDRLAKLNGVKWSEPVVTSELIATTSRGSSCHAFLRVFEDLDCLRLL